MKISELIAKLEEVKKEHGDLPVWTAYYAEWDEVEGKIENTDIRQRCRDMSGLRDSLPKRVVIG